jgi:ribokinase
MGRLHFPLHNGNPVANTKDFMILVAGSANLDFVVRAHHIPAPGETVLGHAFQTFPGGKGANQAVACARAGGVSTSLLAAMGADAFSVPIEASLRDAEVELKIVRIASQPTGTAFICVSDDAENAITVAPGANLFLHAEHLPPLDGVSHLLMQLEIPLETVTAYAMAARQHGVVVVLNAAPVQDLSAELLGLIDILVVNEGELAALSHQTGSIARCLEGIPVPTVVVTLGHHGCCACAQGAFIFQPAFAITPVDTTAAGDTFCGSLVAALSLGADLQRAMRQASAAGALACTRLGAQSSIPNAAEVNDFLAEQAPTRAAATKALRTYCGLPALPPS